MGLKLRYPGKDGVKRPKRREGGLQGVQRERKSEGGGSVLLNLFCVKTDRDGLVA